MTALKSPRERTGVVCDITHLWPYPTIRAFSFLNTCNIFVLPQLPVTVYDWAETRDLPLTDTLHKKAHRPQRCSNMCAGSLMDHQGTASTTPPTLEEKLSQAKDFLTEYYKDSGNREPVFKVETERLKEVEEELRSGGFYELTRDELEWGARTAWRNADRCPARVVWRNLTVFDCRKITSTQGMFEALVRHVEVSLNTGNIQPAITIFRERRPMMKDLRVWNSLVIGFAGYKQEDGSVVGDPNSLEFTKIAESLGWRGAGGRFDLLPWVLSGEDGQPCLYEIPQKLVDTLPLTVDIRHPTIETIGDMELKWFSLPGVSSMMANIGGNQFTAAPFLAGTKRPRYPQGTCWILRGTTCLSPSAVPCSWTCQVTPPSGRT